MSKAKILIVEDEAIIAADLANKVEQLGYAVAGIAIDAHATLGMTADLQPELVLMDINLPGEPDGIETSRMIMRDHGARVVFVSGSADKVTMQRVENTGASGFISKPFNLDDVAGGIRRALEPPDDQTS